MRVEYAADPSRWEETLLFGKSQLGFVHMLLVLVPVSSIIFGMALRLAVTYASRFFRDRWVYRVTVPVMSVLACGSIAAQVALVFQTLTVAVKASASSAPRHLDRSPINVTAQVCATAMSIIARGFFIVRLWELNKSILVRSTAVFLWLGSTALLLAWEVDFSDGNLVLGSRKAWGNAGSWSLFLCALFVGAALFTELVRIGGPSLHTLRLRDRMLAYCKISIESSSLLALIYLACSLTQALRNDSEAALLTSYWTFLVTPLVAIYSVMFSLVSRPPPPATPRSSSFGSRSKRSNSVFSRGGGGDVFSLQRLRCSGAKDFDDDLPAPPAMLETNSQSRPTRGPVLPDGEATARGQLQPDDPRTWRGDAGRLFPALQFDPAHSLASTSGGAGRSVSFRGTNDFDTFSLSVPSVPPFRRESSTPMLGRSPTASFFRRSHSASIVHEPGVYDEALVDQEPTVAKLDLGALSVCDSLVWGPRRRGDEEEDAAVPRHPDDKARSSSPPAL